MLTIVASPDCGQLASAREAPNHWANPETYFDDLPAAMKEASALPGEEALYEQIAAVFETAAKDSALKTALVDSFVAQRDLTPVLRRPVEPAP